MRPEPTARGSVSQVTDGRLGYWEAAAARRGRLCHTRHCGHTRLSGRVAAGVFGHASVTLATRAVFRARFAGYFGRWGGQSDAGVAKATPAWPKRRWRGQSDAGVAKATAASSTGPPGAALPTMAVTDPAAGWAWTAAAVRGGHDGPQGSEAKGSDRLPTAASTARRPLNNVVRSASGSPAPDPARRRRESHWVCASTDDNAAGRDAGSREPDRCCSVAS